MGLRGARLAGHWKDEPAALKTGLAQHWKNSED